MHSPDSAESGSADSERGAPQGARISRRALGLAGLTGAAAAALPGAALGHSNTSPLSVLGTPTLDSLKREGPYAVATVEVPLSESAAFGGGTLFYPASPQRGETFGVVVCVPGFTEPALAMDTVAQRIASHGFAVFSAAARSGLDEPVWRAHMITAALKEALRRPEWAAIIDPARTAIIGHSMAGGGALTAAITEKVSAVIAIHPWSTIPFTTVSEPVLVIGGTWDAIAPMSEHATPIYRSLSASPEKGLLTRVEGTHRAGLDADPLIMPRMISFLKLYVDKDVRYRSLYLSRPEPHTRWETTAR